MPIHADLGGVSEHVVQAPVVRPLSSDRMCAAGGRIPFVPCVVTGLITGIAEVEVCRGIGATSVFPFRFSRQPVLTPFFLGKQFAEGHRIVPAYE